MLRLTIYWSHGGRGPLSTNNVTVRLFAPGAASPLPHSSQGTGRVVFDLDDAHNGQTFSLHVRVVYSPGGRTLNTQGTVPVNMTQGLELNAESPRLRINNTSGRWAGGQDPRIQIERQMAPDQSHNSGEAATATIRLNLDFLDITNAIANVDPTTNQESALSVLRKLSDGKGKRLRILRYTGGSPYLWSAYVSSHISESATSVGVLVFFTPPHSDHNVELTAASHIPALRFLANRQPARLIGHTKHVHSVTRRNEQDTNPNVIDGWSFIDNPDCRFVDQIEASEKPVVLLLPYYSNLRFGRAATENLLQTVRSALVCLFSGGPSDLQEPAADGEREEIISILGRSANGTNMTVSRLAVGGFSRGGEFATNAWAANKGAVSELYLMDPASETYDVRNHTSEFNTWLQGQDRDSAGLISSQEKLCLIGGDYTNFCHEVAQGVTGDVQVRPASEDFFYTSDDYKMMFATNTDPADTDNPTVQILSDWGSPPSPLSAKTGIQIDRAGCQGRQLAIIAPDIATRPSSLVPDHSEHELAAYVGLLRGWYLNGRTDALGTVFDFSQLVVNISNAQDSHTYPRAVGAPGGYPRRHQWPSFGGETINGVFTGYLQFCLQNSGF